jgi:hypothetical protein
MNNTATYWIAQAERHEGFIEGLIDGSIGRSEIVVSNMTVKQAIEVERRNVAYCLKRASEGK